jgi:hypothetical protein
MSTTIRQAAYLDRILILLDPFRNNRQQVSGMTFMSIFVPVTSITMEKPDRISD